jgi:hypothetical protein
MALTIATISLCLFIVLIQHLYNWGIRKLIDVMGEHSFGPSISLTALALGITFLLFKTLIEINKINNEKFRNLRV